MQRATQFFLDTVSAQGGYLWKYSPDLEYREGEGIAGATTSWVQPPGTPTVGLAFLESYQLTGDPLLLRAAQAAGAHLIRGQLISGGWDYRIETDPAARQAYAYRLPPNDPQGRNTTTLDDDTTQSALRFLMKLDLELEFTDEPLHRTVQSALEALMEAQYPNGAWPQRFDAPPDIQQFPVIKAQYPDSWPRLYPRADYRSFYTLNDNTLADMIETMLLAEQIYGQPRYRASAERGGDFLILAQMPEPQPAWAQQYNRQMQPAWARKFEPPAVTGGESQGAIRILLRLYLATGEKRFLAPIPKALDYLQRSELPDGRLARFYELQSNRPLFFTRQYELTYDDGDLPTHYGFLVSSGVSRLRAEYQRALEQDAPRPRTSVRATRRSRPSAANARQIINDLDERGAWITPGSLRDRPDGYQTSRIIDSRVFSRNLLTLAAFAGRGDAAD